MDASATPLATKLGVRSGASVVLLEVPDTVELTVPPDVHIRRRAGVRADVVLACFTELARVEHRLPRLAPMVHPARGLWVAWPKRASGMATDVTDEGVRRAALALGLGLVDNKVCAVDATWTGLRLVWRRDRRGGEPSGR